MDERESILYILMLALLIAILPGVYSSPAVSVNTIHFIVFIALLFPSVSIILIALLNLPFITNIVPERELKFFIWLSVIVVIVVVVFVTFLSIM